MPLELCNAQVTRTYKLKIMAGSQQILSQSATEEKGDIARLASFVGALAVSDLVKTTLGPKGMDKILQSMVRRSGFTCRLAAAAGLLYLTALAASRGATRSPSRTTGPQSCSPYTWTTPPPRC